jgi:Fe-S cluster assembly ATP-binding protein
MLEIDDLHANVGGVPILQGVNLHLSYGEVHVVMGPNGAGKSTLAKVLSGDPKYEIRGSVRFKGRDLLSLAPNERSHAGLFLGFQYPVEIMGVSNASFLRCALDAHRRSDGKTPLSDAEFDGLLSDAMQKMQLRAEFRERSVNGGFSGGEKKRNEMLQMALLAPDLAILDETDSGLDVDALRIVADGINQYRNERRTLLLITHYQRLLDYVRPDYVHVMIGGRIIRSGPPALAQEIEEKGYEWI